MAALKFRRDAAVKESTGGGSDADVMDEAHKARIALIDSDLTRRARVRSWLEGESTNAVIEREPDGDLDGMDVILLDGAHPKVRVAEWIGALRQRGIDALVVVFAKTPTAASDALRVGAWDALAEPLDRDRLEAAVRRARERQELVQRLNTLSQKLEAMRDDQVVPLRELERRAIEKALAATRGSVEKAARMLGMGRATLYRRLATMGAARTV